MRYRTYHVGFRLLQLSNLDIVKLYFIGNVLQIMPRNSKSGGFQCSSPPHFLPIELWTFFRNFPNRIKNVNSVSLFFVEVILIFQCRRGLAIWTNSNWLRLSITWLFRFRVMLFPLKMKDVILHGTLDKIISSLSFEPSVDLNGSASLDCEFQFVRRSPLDYSVSV